ncbi:hypothetical protein [uncultured Eubacterium sp.]|uniref:hypothetical protein n=1 Tax=uncultured Eubacterium sp. TaxID=165185 RepID=UPI0025983663|nr:hypothetical protein [uncultured Eubacterium sp.]
MSTLFANLGIKTYEDYRRNRTDIFDLVYGMFEEYIDKHPEFVKQAIEKSLEHYVTIKDLAVDDVDVFEVSR